MDAETALLIRASRRLVTNKVGDLSESVARDGSPFQDCSKQPVHQSQSPVLGEGRDPFDDPRGRIVGYQAGEVRSEPLLACSQLLSRPTEGAPDLGYGLSRREPLFAFGRKAAQGGCEAAVQLGHEELGVVAPARTLGRQQVLEE